MADESTPDHAGCDDDDAGVYPVNRAAASNVQSTNSMFAGVAATCEAAARLTGVDGAAVAVLSTQSMVRELVHATDALAQQLDELQFVVGEGPCLDAHRGNRDELHADVLADDTANRWPVFIAEAVELGVRALFAFPVPGPSGPVAVLELYRITPGVLGELERDAATACAAAIGATLLRNWNLQLTSSATTAGALDTAAAIGADPRQLPDPYTRTQIHVAAGMVAVQLGISTAEALDRLRAHSFSHHQSITAVAAEVIERRVSFRGDHDDPTER